MFVFLLIFIFYFLCPPLTDFRSKPCLHRGGAERVRAANRQRGGQHQHQDGRVAETEGGARKKTGRTKCSEVRAKTGELLL